MGTTSEGATLSNYDYVMKRFYLEALNSQINDSNIISSVINKNTEDIAGKECTIGIHYGRSGSGGSRADGGTFPEYDYQKVITCTVPMKRHYRLVSFTGPTIAAARTQKGAYASVMDLEIRGAGNDMRKDMNRQHWGCGYGILARWRTTGSGTSYTLQKLYRANSAGGDGFGSTFGGKYLKQDGWAVPVVLTVAASAITTATVDATNIKVTAVAESADYDTITCTDPSVTEAAGTFYIRPANLITYNASNNTGGARLESMGLRGIVTNEDMDEIALKDGTNTSPHVDPLQSLDADSYSWWNAEVDSHPSGRYAGQRAITFKLIRKMIDNIQSNVGEERDVANLIISGKAVRREVLEHADAMKRIVNQNFADLGWNGIELEGRLYLVDDDCPDGEMYFLTTRDLQLYMMSDYNWMSKDHSGAILHRQANVDAYEAALYRYSELGCTRRDSHGVITDLIYST